MLKLKTHSARRWTPTLVATLIAASVVLSVSMGVRQSLGLFLTPVAVGTGISVASFGLVIAFQNLVWGISQPAIGAIADRYGGLVVVLVGSILLAGGLFMMTLGSETALYVGGGLVIGIAVAATSHGVLVGIISRQATDDLRNLSVSILASAGALGTFLIAPSAQALLNRFSWETSLLILAVLAFSMVTFAPLLRDQSSTGETAFAERPDALAAIRRACSHPGFVIMTLAFFACGFQLTFVATHLPNYVAICGLPPSVGASAIALIGLFNAFGTYFAGKLGEVYGHKLVLAGIYALRTLAIAVYASLPASQESTLIFGAAMGLLWLSVIAPVSNLLHSMFGSTNFGTLFGIMFFSHQVGAFLGAYVGGLSFDVTSDYTVAWLSLVFVGALAAAMQYKMNETPQKPRAA